MSWMNLFGSSSSNSAKSSIPPPTALQRQRLKQIDTLRTFHHSVTEVQRDVEYRVTFNVGSSTVFLNVTLPAQFPNEKPVVKVSPPLSHPWVNDQMVVVGCPALNSFYMHSSLGKAVQEVVREFCEHQPQFVNQQASGPIIGGYQPPSTYSFSGYQPPVTPFSSSQFGSSSSGHMFPSSSGSGAEPSSSAVTSHQVDSTISGSRVTESREFPELNDLSLEELKELNDNSNALDEFEKKLESVKKLQEQREGIMLKNEEVARYNLSLQPKFESCKDTIINNYELLSQSQEEFAKKNQLQKDMIAAFSLVNIHKSLEIAAAQVELESDEIADEFLDGKMTTEEFVQKFMEKRKLGHLRRAKEEKLRSVHTRF